MASEDGRTKVLYISGSSRCGSTILGNVLGQLPDYVAVGEVANIWGRGLVANGLCGCGAAFAECDFWAPVMRQAFRGDAAVDAQRLNQLTLDQTRARRLPQFLAGPQAVKSSRSVQELQRALRKLYESISHTSGARIIVDTSKRPLYGALLSLVDSLDVRTLHLVRDPRAVAYSRATPKRGGGRFFTESTGSVGVLSTSWMWISRNWIARHLGSRGEFGPYMECRYEDFVRDPASTIQTLTRFMGKENLESTVTAHGAVSLGRTHTVYGNPGRFDVGQVTLTEDLRWCSGLSGRDRLLVSCLTLPWLTRYRYAFWKCERQRPQGSVFT